MRVLVTGGAGFIGSHIADLLAESGHEPLLLDSFAEQAHGGRVPGYCARHELVRGSVTDAALLRELLSGVDAVSHQAAVVGHGVSAADAPDYALHNDYGTAVLLAAMYETGVRKLVLASSMVVYGEGRYHCARHGIVTPAARAEADLAAGSYDPRCPDCGAGLESRLVPEDAPVRPRSTYAATKLAQENLATAWAVQTGGSVFALRYHNVYGARMPRDTPYSGVAALFRSALREGKPPRVFEDGGQRRDFVHVTDIALANRLALETESGHGESVPLNVCSGDPHTIAEMATELARACGGPAPEIVGGARAADVRHVVADPERARRLLGFRARTGFAEGIADFAHAPLRG
ncbi:NAD-dependent epimerase/dehydratase family protein [Sciscionella sediminilitoris]|uniref:NAD-dependent epimerase/dehydratase family protein n=1 Tax=Sciscionella sediminilitoris TaxID=1445613 RepID=UPI0004DF9344|nr:NAD-dependent epimerase/dehydratase family protein [Sciscionella sp. SE31]